MTRMTLILGEALMDCIAQADGSLLPLMGGSPFNLARAALIDSGRYSCAVTNALGTAISEPALLTVVPFRDAGRLISLSVLTSLDAPDTEFTVGLPGKKALAPGASTTFKVTFKPAAAGSRIAVIKIASNDSNENPFDIKLTGTGIK